MRSNCESADPALLQTVVLANRILFNQGVIDAFGHVSARVEDREDRFLLARSIAPYQVTEADILTFTLEGEEEAPSGKKLYSERFIHSEIYRRFPGVHAIVHAHSPAIIPFSVARSTRLRSLSHMAGFIGNGAPIFDLTELGVEGSDLLIRNKDHGQALACCFDESSIVLMRGHGLTIVAPNLKLAVYRAVYANFNAQCQLDALQLGDVKYLSDAEAVSCARTTEGDVERPWAMWVAQLDSRPQ